jgi:DNA gyrase inhibitor GyrI
MRQMTSDDYSFNSVHDLQEFILMSTHEISSLFKVFNSPKRIEILARLLIDTAYFSELVNETDLQKSSLSNHLISLTDLKLVEKLERGLYTITNSGTQLLETITNLYLNNKLLDNDDLEGNIQRLNSLVSKFCKIKGVTKLNEEVRIVTLDNMRVASIRTISVSPESDGWSKLKPWAMEKGIFDDAEKYLIFGFDNPGPHEKDEANRYGYEHWIKIDDTIIVDGEFAICEIPSQKYAVLRCKGVVNIGKKWKELVSWRSKSKYEHECANCVEKIVNRHAMGPDDLVLDLYLPIKEKKL